MKGSQGQGFGDSQGTATHNCSFLSCEGYDWGKIYLSVSSSGAAWWGIGLERSNLINLQDEARTLSPVYIYPQIHSVFGYFRVSYRIVNLVKLRHPRQFVRQRKIF